MKSYQGTVHLFDSDSGTQEIYVTSAEEIIDGNWWVSRGDKFISNWNIEWCNKFQYKKIILTSDPKLIEDGVQALSDSFIKDFFDSYNQGEKVERVPFKIVGCRYSFDMGGNIWIPKRYEIIKDYIYSDIQKNSLRLNKEFVDNTSEKELERIMQPFDKLDVRSREKIIETLEFKVDDPRENGGQSVCISPRGIILKSDELGIEIKMNHFRSQHRNKEFAMTLMLLAIDEIIK